MKRMIAVILCAAIPAVGFAAENCYKVKYDGGSVPNIKSGNDLRLNFDASQITLAKDKAAPTNDRNVRNHGNQLRPGRAPVLVQREMERGRAPLASIANSEGQFVPRKRLRPGGRGQRPKRNWFQEKGNQFGGSHSHQVALRRAKATGYEENIEHARIQPRPEALPAGTWFQGRV